MSTQRKALCAIILLVLALFLIVGVAIMSTHVALGVFLTTAALMLGPFAGLALLVYGVAGKRGVVTRSLYSLGGMLIIGAIGGIFALSMEQAPAMLPLFVAGAGVGIVAVLTQAPKRA